MNARGGGPCIHKPTRGERQPMVGSAAWPARSPTGSSRARHRLAPYARDEIQMVGGILGTIRPRCDATVVAPSSAESPSTW